MGFEGNSDLYGIGVRIGLYSQWFATLLITLFDPEAESDARIANIIIQFAIFIGLCVQSTDASASAVGSVITQFLLCGSLSSLTGDGIGYLDRLSGLLRVMFYAGLSSYGCWFYFRGIDLWVNQPGYADYANIAFFGSSQLAGRFRAAGKVVSVLGLCVSVASFLWGLVKTSRQISKNGINSVLNRRTKGRPQVEIALLILSMGLLAFSIAIIEYLIRMNNVGGLSQVESVGQFIPLLIGTLTAALEVWKIGANGLFLKPRCWFLFGKHLWLGH